MDQIFNELQKITDAIRANAVETNLQIQELRKTAMESGRGLNRLITELIPDPPEENDDPIDYPPTDYVDHNGEHHQDEPKKLKVNHD